MVSLYPCSLLGSERKRYAKASALRKQEDEGEEEACSRGGSAKG